jgi:UDP:flavonoid glycosyltransferase YjiC (YdhE family)
VKIVLAPMGTEGDVLPMIALAIELTQRKHRVVVAAPTNYSGIAARYGLPFQAIGVNTAETMRQSRFSVEALAHEIECSFAGLPKAAKQCDVVVGSPFQLAGPSTAELYGARFYLMISAPVFIDIIRGFRWLTELVPSFNHCRAKIGLERVADISEHLLSHTILNASESAVLDASNDCAQSMITTGTWSLIAKLKPLPRDLTEFCEATPRPIYIGFGSMVQNDPKLTATKVVDALQETEMRAVISLGWSGFEKAQFPRTCFVVSEAAHEHVFRRVAAAIHHGGAGTTAAALAAGIPQGIVPHLADQKYWGNLIANRGIGVTFTSQSDLTAPNLAIMIRRLTQEAGLAANAKAVARLVSVRGVSIAADILEGSIRR